MPKRTGNIQIVKRILLGLLFALLISFNAGQIYAQDSEDRLFHIERSKNRNMVCYDANIIDGKLDPKEPIKVYWYNREDKPGQVQPLSAIQKRLAYGYKVVSSGDDTFDITLSAYSDRTLTVKKSAGGKYICTMIIDGRTAILQKLYVQAKGRNSLTVEYVELSGISVDDETALSEKVRK